MLIYDLFITTIKDGGNNDNVNKNNNCYENNNHNNNNDNKNNNNRNNTKNSNNKKQIAKIIFTIITKIIAFITLVLI